MNPGQAGNRLIAGLFLFLLCIVLAGCSLTPSAYLYRAPGTNPKTIINDVPFYAQDELQCGPAALAMALNWSGISIEPSVLSPQVFTPGLKGSLQNSLIGTTRRHGRVAYPIEGIETLMSEVSAGHPVIVLVNLGFSWYPTWHYAVVIGYDQQNKNIILHSGLTAHEVMSFWSFNNVWKRSQYWGLLVLPPNRMPATVDEPSWVSAVMGLENVGQWQAAAMGYATASKRWDDSFLAWMGLGLSKYKLGDLESAANALYRATTLQPENAMAFNNLAHILASQGRLDEALSAAKRAVALESPLRATFLQTLEEIKKMKTNQIE